MSLLREEKKCCLLESKWKIKYDLLLRLWYQSHQPIPTHMLTIADNQRDAYDSRVCLYCPSGVTGSEIHLILECPETSHVALDLIQFLTTLLYAPANQIGAP